MMHGAPTLWLAWPEHRHELKVGGRGGLVPGRVTQTQLHLT